MPTRRVLTFSATAEGFGKGAGEVRRTLEATGLSARMRYNVELVFEELVTNIIRHGTSHARESSEVHVTLELDEPASVLTIEDNGPAFDPCDQEAPKVPRTLDEAKVGGLGLVLVRKAVSRMDYERTAEGHNRLTVTIGAA